MEVELKHNKRKPFNDKLKLLAGAQPVITKNKLNKIRLKLNAPAEIIDEARDNWGDDMEVDI